MLAIRKKKVAHDYNEKPNPAVFGPPDRLATNDAQHFLALKANAEKLEQNRKIANKQKSTIAEAKFFQGTN